MSEARGAMGEVSGGRTARRRPRCDFLARSVAGVTGAVEQAIFREEYARQEGLLQRIDPRAKVAGLLLLILAAALVRHLPLLLGLYGVALGLAWFSRLPPWFFVKRVWLGIPLFAGIVMLPALFTLPGATLLPVLDAGPVHLAVTDRSLATVVLFLVRVGTCVSLAVLLVVTTRWADLLQALSVLRVPEAFIVVMSMAYRYIFLLLHLAGDFLLARQSRTIGVTSGREQRRWIAASLGALLGRSLKLSEDVHLAMRARGFNGQVRTLRRFRMADADWLMVLGAVLVATGVLLLDLR